MNAIQLKDIKGLKSYQKWILDFGLKKPFCGLNLTQLSVTFLFQIGTIFH